MPAGLCVDEFNARLLSAKSPAERAANTEQIRQTVRTGLASQLFEFDQEIAGLG